MQCDVWEFENAISRGDELEADRLYRGPFLDGFSLGDSPEYEPWVDGERRRLASLHTESLERLAASCVARGDWTDAVRVRHRLVAGDPGNARLTIQLMQALDATGDRAGALRLAATHAALLRTEFDTHPDADVEALAERLRRDTRTRRLLPDENPAGGGSPGSIPIAPAPVAGKYGTRTRLAKRSMSAAAAVFLAAGALSGSAWWFAARSATRDLDPDVVAVVPFRVTAPDSSYDYLGEGVMDLAGMLLTGDGTPRPVDPRGLLVAYRRAQQGTDTDLTIAECLALARRFGAGQLLAGELVITPQGATMTARLMDVASGRVVAQHADQGIVDTGLTTRVIAGVLAKSHGEGASRLSGLSDSAEAVRAYLLGMQTYRGTRPRESFSHFNRAVEVDPASATAALWRALLGGNAFVFGTPARRRIDSVAWSLRGRLSRRDSLVLVTLPSIGPNFPAPSTARELFHALERAADANPDRVEVWDALATHLQPIVEPAAVSVSPAPSSARAIPKSATTAEPAAPLAWRIRMFSGLMSRRTTPCRCAYSSPAATSRAMRTASSSRSCRSRRSLSRRDSPTTYGITVQKPGRFARVVQGKNVRVGKTRQGLDLPREPIGAYSA